MEPVKARLLGWLGRLAGLKAYGWYAVAALVAVCLASLRGCAEERTERARLAAAVKQAAIQSESYRAALLAKDKMIRDLTQQIQDFDCRGSLNRVQWPDGKVEWRCEGESTTHTVYVKDRSEQATTPPIPLPPVLPPVARVPVWQVGAGGGVNADGGVFYLRGAYRFAGPLGADVIGLYPAGVMAGVNVAF